MKPLKEVQRSVRWLNLDQVRTEFIHKEFKVAMQEKYPNKKDFGFRKKLNVRYKRTFTPEELDIIADIKVKAIKDISEGRFEYIYKSYFIENYLIPALEVVNKSLPITTKNNPLGIYGEKRSLEVSSITSGFNNVHSPFISEGCKTAIPAYKLMELK